MEALARSEHEVIALYLAGLGASSRRSARKHVKAWLLWCSDNALNLWHVERSHIEVYGVWIEESLGHTRRTRKDALIVVRELYRFLYEEGYIDHDPSRYVRLPRIPRFSDGSCLSREQAVKFLRLTDVEVDPCVRAACRLFLLNGLRVGEAIGLDVEDVEFLDDGGIIRVIRKGGVLQHLRVTEKTAGALRAAIGGRTGSEPVLVNTRGSRMSEQIAHRHVSRIAGVCGAERSVGPHALRRTFATLCRDAGIADRDIMASGGWTSSEMLEYYDMGRRSVHRNVTHRLSDYLEDTEVDKGGDGDHETGEVQ